MGQTPSKPQPGTHLKVIAAGLPRTGTASLTAALELLLQGPVYHAGIQHTLSYPNETPLKTAISLLQNHTDPAETKHILAALFDEGYVGVADSPFAQYTPELLALYPSAIVICSTREPPSSWLRSLDELLKAGRIATGWHTCLVPIARLFPRYTRLLMSTRWADLYGPLQGVDIYRRHVEWLEEVVPREKLFFVDVRDGWEPLCRALKVPMPVGLPFPRVNDGAEVSRIAKQFVARGIVRWAAVTSSLVVVSLAAGWQIWRTS